MKRGRWTPLLAGVVVLVPFGVQGLEGCYTSVPNDGLVDAGKAMAQDVAVADGFVGPGEPCDGASGVIPAPNCTVTRVGVTPSCAAPAGNACTVGKNSSGGSCGTTDCFPLANNTAPVFNFRMQTLHISSPPALANVLVQNSIITPGITLNATPVSSSATETCAYANSGSATGAFTWLLSVNKMTNTIVTGGAPPVLDPYNDSYCFVNGTFSNEGGAPITVHPFEAGVSFDGSTFSTTPSTATLFVPIFTLVAADPGVPIILPIKAPQLSDVTISADGNCIGDVNPAWYPFATGACNDNAQDQCPKWYTDGALSGYITLASANAIPVPAIGGHSLCTLLVGDNSAMTCSAAELNMGDYCSTTNPPGPTGCTDSFWLSATFAANAVKIASGGSSLCGP